MLLLWASLLMLPASPAAIIERNVFCSGCATRRDPPTERVALPLELVAILRAPDQSLAAIASRDRRDTALYAVGERLGEARIEAIGARRVRLRVGARVAELSLDDQPAPPPDAAPPPSSAPEIRCGGGRCDVDRALVKRLIADPSVMATWVRVAPAPRGGLMLLAVRPGSPLQQLGLESGDRLHALNGAPLGNVTDMLNAYVKLKTASRVSIGIERKGALKTFDYAIR
jgi:general secretion pathway protein C